MNDRSARLLLGRLRRMQDTSRLGKPFVLPQGCVSRLDLVERRLIEALDRDASGSVERDGYPSGGMGDGGARSGASVRVEDEYGSTDTVPVTSTEAAAFARLGRQERDPHHELTELAARHLEQAANAIDGLLTALDDIDKLANPNAWKPDPSGSCLVCDRHVEGTAADRLRRGMCHTDYMAWVRHGRPDLVEFKRDRREAA